MSQTSRRKQLEVHDDGEIAVVSFIDREIFDEYIIQKIGEDLFSLVDELGKKKVLLNFSDVEYMSSLALGKFLTLQHKLKNTGGKLGMCCIEDEVYETFELTKMNRLFDIQKEEQTALEALRKS